MKKLINISCTILLMIAGPALAENWYVHPDGSGDAPTIQAAVNAASSGDDILVSGGEYYEEVVVDGKDLDIFFNNGIAYLYAPTPGSGTGFTFRNISGSSSVMGFTMEGFSRGVEVEESSTNVSFMTFRGCGTAAFVTGSGSSPTFGSNLVDSCTTGIMVENASMVDVQRQTIVNCDDGLVVGGGLVNAERNIIVHCFNGISVTGGSITVDCNNVWNNDFNYSGWSAGATDISQDPMFCYRTPGSPGLYYLHQDSPCLSANNVCGVNMGYQSTVGCTGTDTRESSWGGIKEIFR